MSEIKNRHGHLLFGEAQTALFCSLSASQIAAISDARYATKGWIIERCVKSLRDLEIIEERGLRITGRGMQMKSRIAKAAEQE